MRPSRAFPSKLSSFSSSVKGLPSRRMTRGSSPSMSPTLSTSVSLPNLQRSRRVNPDVLVNRLPPGLVVEMDKLIKSDPHSMPSYSVRKELQERYDVDRRPIYEYFHAQGCRVIRKNHDFPERSLSSRQLTSVSFTACRRIYCSLWKLIGQ